MRLLRVHVVKAATCGGLLDGLDLRLRHPRRCPDRFDPLCLVGPNGSGKSQLLQVIAEMFQAALHACASDEERIEGNPDLQFELEYIIKLTPKDEPAHVRLKRVADRRRKLDLVIEVKENSDWRALVNRAATTRNYLPKRVVGYTSGENETLSLPFLVSRSGYADEVGRAALEGRESTERDF